MSTSLTPPTEDYVLYADKRRMFRSLSVRMLLVLVPILSIVFIGVGYLRRGGRMLVPLLGHSQMLHGRWFVWVHFPPLHNAILDWAPWFFVAEAGLVWGVSAFSQLRQVKPIVTLSPSGITMGTLAMIGEICWDEVREVRCYTMLLNRFVGIWLTNPDVFFKRLDPRRLWLLRLNERCNTMLGLKAAQINMAQLYLPVKADALVAIIHLYQNAYGSKTAFGQGGLLASQDRVWPPAPTALPPRRG